MDVKLLSPSDVKEELAKNNPDKIINLTIPGKGVELGWDDGFILHTGPKHSYKVPLNNIDVLTRRVGISSGGMYNEYPNLLVHNFNYVAPRKSLSGKLHIKDDNVVSFSTDDGYVVKGEKVIDLMEKNIPGVAFDQVYKTSGDIQHLHAFSQDKKFITNIGDKANKDIFRHGVTVEYSPTGIALPKVHGYALRTICMNGQIGMGQVFRSTVGDNDEHWFDINIKKAFKYTSTFVDKIKSLLGVKLNKAKVEDALESLYEDLRVPKKIRERISLRIAEHGADTAYDLYNHLTYVASHYKVARENPDFIPRLMESAGKLVEHQRGSCSSCNRLFLR